MSSGGRDDERIPAVGCARTKKNTTDDDEKDTAMTQSIERRSRSVR
jgi:hypothetical protein